jgi:hypothetical protein
MENEITLLLREVFDMTAGGWVDLAHGVWNLGRLWLCVLLENVDTCVPRSSRS